MNTATAMTNNRNLTRPDAYDPNRLFDTLLRTMNLEDDEALSQRLHVSRTLLFRIRCGRSRLAAPLLIRISEHSGMPVADLRRIAGDRRRECRLEETVHSHASPAPVHTRVLRAPRDELIHDDAGLPRDVQWS